LVQIHPPLGIVTEHSPENENISTEWRLLQHHFHQSSEPLKSSPQISESSRDPNPGTALQLDSGQVLHDRKRHANTGSTPLSTVTNA